MKSFLKFTLATIVGVLITSILLFFIFLSIIGAIVSSAEKEVVIQPNSILQLEFSKPIPERTSTNPFENFDWVHMKPSVTLGLNDILKNIEKAKTDPAIKGIYLDASIIPTQFGTIEELRNALLDFKKSGKFIVSYSEFYTHGSYYLASVADSIFINPMGSITFLGLSSQTMFYKGALKKLGIEPEVIRHGKFKSAIEPFINDKMSPENRQQVSVLLNSLWGHLVKGISEARKIPVSKLNELADNMSLADADKALSSGMVDGLRYKDQVLNTLSRESGVARPKDLQFVSLGKYNKSSKKSRSYSRNKIAVIYADGEIVMGDGDEQQVGSESLSEAIRSARTDSTIKAIVLRINSPGGSALASEVIWRELHLAEKVKPLIISMGSLAASGGYYIATPGDTIVAEPTTITGSIGVFGILFNAKNFFNDKLGITTDVVQTNKHGDTGTPFRPLTPDERAMIQSQIEHIYDVFVTRVSEGRKISKASVDSIGQGRVWSAFDAKRLGLVDLIGGIDTAMNIAAQKAGLTDYRIVSLPKPEEPLKALLEDFSTKVRMNMVKQELGEASNVYFDFQQFLHRQGIMARIPYDLNIY